MYLPKEWSQMFGPNKEPIGTRMKWFQSEPLQYTLPFCMYYSSGSWRHVIVSFNPKKYTYSFQSTFYFKDASKGVGNEITKDKWKELGFMVGSDDNSIGEIIEDNDPDVLKWLETKGALISTPKKMYASIARAREEFDMTCRDYISRSENTAYKKMFEEKIQELEIRQNIEAMYTYFKEYPKERICKIERFDIEYLYSINQLKQINSNPEHLIQSRTHQWGKITC